MENKAKATDADSLDWNYNWQNEDIPQFFDLRFL